MAERPDTRVDAMRTLSPKLSADRRRAGAPAALVGRLAGVLLALAVPTAAQAQAGWYATPSLTLMATFDSNVQGAANGGDPDGIFSVLPGLTLGYYSDQLTVLGFYSASAELYVEHDEFNNVGDYQQGGLTFAYRATPRLDLNLGVSYTRTPETSNF